MYSQIQTFMYAVMSQKKRRLPEMLSGIIWENSNSGEITSKVSSEKNTLTVVTKSPMEDILLW